MHVPPLYAAINTHTHVKLDAGIRGTVQSMEKCVRLSPAASYYCFVVFFITTIPTSDIYSWYLELDSKEIVIGRR